MATFKCKMCGGTLEITLDNKLCICEYCGTQQTLPRLDTEKKENLYARANHLRRNNDFDKAMSLYETILNEDTTDAEAYWSIVLCHYGIEYVVDPATNKRVPTCHRTQYASIFTNPDYKKALEYADAEQKYIYEAEATAIDRIQKGILAISQKEDPFDVFICYKETDEQGQRTIDSVLAQDIYFQLVNQGYKVFFSRITLEDKLGQAYEPYIFSALNTAKVMIVVGTRPEFFNAVWVKNEWSRFLAMIKEGKNKVIIPAYRDMDPYTIPEEFSHLQAQDMSKIGFAQDLLRGVAKVCKKDNADTVCEIKSGAEMPLIKRALLSIEDGEFEKADEILENALNLNPENAEIYVAQLLVSNGVKTFDELVAEGDSLTANPCYLKALRFADNKLKTKLEEANKKIVERIEKEWERERNAKYLNLCMRQEQEKDKTNIDWLISEFEKLGDYEDALARADALKAEIYENACKKMDKVKSVKDITALQAEFRKLEDYKDSSEKVNLLSKKMVDQDKKGALAVLIAVAAIVCVFFAIPLIKHMLLLR